MPGKWPRSLYPASLWLRKQIAQRGVDVWAVAAQAGVGVCLGVAALGKCNNTFFYVTLFWSMWFEKVWRLSVDLLGVCGACGIADGFEIAVFIGAHDFGVMAGEAPRELV